jgi:pyridoxamine 5'-phosphate oxidase
MTETADTQAASASTSAIHAETLDNPLAQFHEWHAQWSSGNITDPAAAAAVLATADAAGRPSARLVDIARVDHGFVFFTNYDSRKGTDLANNPLAALCFAWLTLGRQIRVEGAVERLTDVESDTFFATLSDCVQLLSWASDQRQTITDQDVLAQRLAEVDRRFAGQEIPRSRHWGGYRLVPDSIEFWQGQGDVHTERLRYRRPDADTEWIFERLMP